MPKAPNNPEPVDFYSDKEAMGKAMGKAVYDALRTHKLLGHPIVIWRDGKVVCVPPEEIELPEELNGQHAAVNGVPPSAKPEESSESGS
jgi:hypothetical protein